MKTIRELIIAVLLCVGASVQAVDFSTTNGGIYVAVAAWRNGYGFVTNKTIRFDDELLWHPFSEAGSLTINYPTPSYLMKITLIDGNGKELPRTSLGKLFGTKFDKVKRYEDTDEKVSGGFVINSGYGGAFTDGVFYSPASLFEIEKPGIYTMTMEMQMFQIVYGTTNFSRKLIRFSPVSIKVDKP